MSDILTRLLVKSIIRFRCVSKSWNSIITNPIFITIHLVRAKSLSNNNSNKNHNGFLLYIESCKELRTVVCNSDRTLTQISTLKIPFSNIVIVDYCNGMFCLRNYQNHILYLWNPSIRKFKMLGPPHLTDPSALIAYGLGYHSQNNDFKIVRIVLLESKVPPVAKAEVYTLSTDSWRRIVISLESEPNIGYIDFIDVLSPGLFFNGALHSTVFSGDYKFILSFEVNDETFRPIMLPQNFFDEMLALSFDSLGVFKGSLALFVCGENLDGDADVSHIWVMREYGVVESWTKIIVPVDSAEWFWGCTDSGELLLNTFERGLVSYELESLNENNLGIQNSPWLSYTADLMESLVLLDQVKCHLNMKIRDKFVEANIKMKVHIDKCFFGMASYMHFEHYIHVDIFIKQCCLAC